MKTFNQFINESKGVHVGGTKINNSDISLTVKRTSDFQEFVKSLEDLYNVNFSDSDLKILKKEYKNILN